MEASCIYVYKNSQTAWHFLSETHALCSCIDVSNTFIFLSKVVTLTVKYWSGLKKKLDILMEDDILSIDHSEWMFRNWGKCSLSCKAIFTPYRKQECGNFFARYMQFMAKRIFYNKYFSFRSCFLDQRPCYRSSINILLFYFLFQGFVAVILTSCMVPVPQVKYIYLNCLSFCSFVFRTSLIVFYTL